MIQARHYTKGRKKTPSLVVLHTMEALEKSSTAAAVANWFAGAQAPQASAHYCVDDENILQCVADADTAWHVKGGDINARGIGIEMAGYARQTTEQWQDEFSQALLVNVAKLTAQLCTQHSIPVVYVPPEELLKGKSGITTHAACSKAFKVPGGHTDPGPNFPMADFLILVKSFVVYPENV